ncbi:MAG: D-xylose transporter XylE, partial [Verrucomicrobia bacterium]
MKKSIVLFTFAASLGGFLYGYDMAIVSGTIGYLKAHFQLDPKLTGWAVSSVVVGGMFGSGMAGFLGDRYGRKWALIGCAILFIGAAILAATARSITFFTAARFLGGIAIGAASMLSPLYIAEIAPAHARGKLVSCYQLAIVVAICLVFFINLQIQRASDETWNITTGWRWMFASTVLPAG